MRWSAGFRQAVQSRSPIEAGPPLRIQPDTRRLLNTVTSLSVDLLFDSAGLVPAAPGRRLGTLDALHLTTAISLGGDFQFLLTYDHQLRDAALAHNLSVASPI